VQATYVAESRKTNCMIGSRGVLIPESLPVCRWLPAQTGCSAALMAAPKSVASSFS